MYGLCTIHHRDMGIYWLWVFTINYLSQHFPFICITPVDKHATGWPMCPRPRPIVLTSLRVLFPWFVNGKKWDPNMISESFTNANGNIPICIYIYIYTYIYIYGIWREYRRGYISNLIWFCGFVWKWGDEFPKLPFHGEDDMIPLKLVVPHLQTKTAIGMIDQNQRRTNMQGNSFPIWKYTFWCR